MRESSTARWSWRLLAVLAATSMLVTGCSGDGDEPSSREKPSQTPQGPSGENGNIKDAVGARTDLGGFTCAVKKGAWSATGKLTNPEDRAATYLVRVSISDKKSNTVLGNTERSVTVKASGSAKVAFKRFHTGDPGATCSARVVKGS